MVGEREHVPRNGDQHRRDTGHGGVGAVLALHRDGQKQPSRVPGVRKLVEIDTSGHEGVQEAGVVVGHLLLTTLFRQPVMLAWHL
jgi:hypothetical protein